MPKVEKLKMEEKFDDPHIPFVLPFLIGQKKQHTP
jgi:hypothetical protein